MMLGHMRETHTDLIPAQFIIKFVSISAHVCFIYIIYYFIYKGLIDQVILCSQMCIRKCKITALIFLWTLNVGAGLYLNGIAM